MRQSVIQKDWCANFMVKVTVRIYVIGVWLFLLCLLNCWSFCNQTLMVHHHKPQCLVRKCNVDCHVHGQDHWSFKMSMNVFLGDIFWTTEPNLVWWCIIMSRRIMWKDVSGQGHVEGSYNQNRTVSTISFELLILLQPNLGWWYVIKSLSVSWKDWITLFKVKVTAMVSEF